MGFPFPTHGGGVGTRFSPTQMVLWSYKKQRLSSPLGKGIKKTWQNYSLFCGEISMQQRGRDTTQIRNVKNLIKGTVWERKGHSRGAAKAAAANGCRVLSRHKKTTPSGWKPRPFVFLIEFFVIIWNYLICTSKFFQDAASLGLLVKTSANSVSLWHSPDCFQLHLATLTSPTEMYIPSQFPVAC